MINTKVFFDFTDFQVSRTRLILSKFPKTPTNVSTRCGSTGQRFTTSTMAATGKGTCACYSCVVQSLYRPVLTVAVDVDC